MKSHKWSACVCEDGGRPTQESIYRGGHAVQSLSCCFHSPNKVESGVKFKAVENHKLLLTYYHTHLL